MKSYKWFSYVVVGFLALVGLYHLFFSFFGGMTGTTLYGGGAVQGQAGVTWSPNNTMVSTQEFAASPRKMLTQINPPSDTIPLSKLNKRKIIKNADLSIEVKHVATTVKKVRLLITKNKGYIESSFYNKGTEMTGANTSMMLRIPAVQLMETLAALKKMSLRVIAESISADDITKQYFDLKSQLVHLSLAEDQLNMLLSKATKIEAKLSLFKLLAQKQQAISRIRSQISYYDKAVSMSKIRLFITQPKVIKQEEARSWSITPVATLAYQSLLNSLSALLTYTLYFLIYILPILFIWSVIISIAYYIVRLIIRRGRRHHD